LRVRRHLAERIKPKLERAAHRRPVVQRGL
jgi:hypothetical protein